MTARTAIALGLAVALSAAACAGGPATSPGAATAPVEGVAAASLTRAAPSGLSPEELARRGEAAGLLNLAEVAPGLFRGAQPEGDAAFAALADLGVKTILSVDGSLPDAAAAASHGIRTVHIPVEYSGFTRGEEVRIAKVALEIPGPLFVHCHHGKHRGPAACGVAWMAREGVSPAVVVADMRKAGTDPVYAGLYGAVTAFRAVTPEELATVSDADLPSAAKLPGLVEAMVAIDRTFDRMKEVRKSGWRTPASMPDVQPAQEARILAERFRELGRTDGVKGRSEDFREKLSMAEKLSFELEDAVRGEDASAAAGPAMDRVATMCASCHAVYRNPAQR